VDGVHSAGGAMTAAILLLLLAGTSPPGAAMGAGEGSGSGSGNGNPGSDACRLLTAVEIAAIAGGRVAETKPTSRTAGGLAISDCFYRSESFEGSVSLELTRTPKDSTRNIRDHWRAMFHPEEEREHEEEPRVQRMSGEASPKGKEKDSPPQPVEGLGDEAFWLANPASGVLYVLRGDAYLRISVGGGGDDSSKRRQSAELARKALSRL